MSGSIPYHAQYALRTIFRRCIGCADQQPSCPACKSDETCIQQPGDGCNTCPQAVCVPATQAGMPSTSSQSSSGGPNVGAIAGGVVGGVVFIAVITFIIWRFCIRPRYNNWEGEEQEYSDEYMGYSEEKSSPRAGETDFTPTSQARQSHQSARSVASTVMTRASNVIQIAFIPGITDRQNHHDDDGDVPPVPAIPASQQRNTFSSTASPINRDNHPGTPDHFFTPADLAGTTSRWSQFSNSTMDSEDVRSTRHQSLASSLARESVASTIYGDGHQAAVATPMSASQLHGVRGRANVVSVKPSTGNTPGSVGHVPDVPSVDYFKYGDAKKAREAEQSNKQHPLAESTTPAAESTESEATKKPSNRMLAAAIEEATRRASRQPTHGGLGSLAPTTHGQSSQLAKPEEQGLKQRDPSPFSDSNAVNTP